MIAALNRFTLRFQKTFISLLLLSVPVFLLGLGYMLKLTIEHSPWWVTAGIVVSWLTVLLGLASLLDDLERREPQKPHDQ